MRLITKTVYQIELSEDERQALLLALGWIQKTSQALDDSDSLSSLQRTLASPDGLIRGATAIKDYLKGDS